MIYKMSLRYRGVFVISAVTSRAASNGGPSVNNERKIQTLH